MIEQLAGAARVAEVQPYPTVLFVLERGMLIEARKNELVCHHLVPWTDMAKGTNAAADEAFRSVREAMKQALKEQKAALRKVDAA